MTKITIASLILGLGVVAVGGYYWFNSNQSADLLSQSETSTTTSSGKKMAFSEFIKQGGSYKCTVNQLVNNIEVKGITYLNNKMIRGEYKVEAQGFNIGTTLIVRDGFTYTWTSMAPTMGFKAKVVEGVGANSNAGTSGTYSFNAEQIGDYDCQPWVADNSKFTLPTGVNFQEI